MGRLSKNRIVAVALLVAGCGSGGISWGRKLGVGPNGREQILITCIRDVGRCYAAAALVCKGAFDTVPMNKDMVVPSNSGAVIVECRGAPPDLARLKPEGTAWKPR